MRFEITKTPERRYPYIAVYGPTASINEDQYSLASLVLIIKVKNEKHVPTVYVQSIIGNALPKPITNEDDYTALPIGLQVIMTQ